MKKFDSKENDYKLTTIKLQLNHHEMDSMSPYATLSSQGLRRMKDENEESGYRQSFSLDVDRILHSLAYTRYIDKTQVFYLIQNDHITHRVLHVQLVSKVSRTIGRFLGLNEDLIEAIALGHDIGHAPFGHDGERYLAEHCRAAGIGEFHHNIQSVQFLDKVERKGKGWNLCLQTLDGILSHDGEIHNQQLEPNTHKSFDILNKEIELKKSSSDSKLIPMTLEGCVVRMADTISYIGRDLEDAIRLNIISRKHVPQEASHILGNTNGTIVYRLVTDIIQNSYQKNSIAFSPEVSDALRHLKHFNLEHIYRNPKIKEHSRTIKDMFAKLFEKYFDDIVKENHRSVIFTNFLEDMAPEYIVTHDPAEIVRDFIAGMTDQYFLSQFPEEMRPKRIEII
jgi:dGTPase